MLFEIRSKLVASGFTVETSMEPRENLGVATTQLRVGREGRERMVIVADAHEVVEIIVTTVNGLFGTTCMLSTSVDGAVSAVEEAFADDGR